MSYAASATAIGISQDTWYNWMNHGNAGKSPYAAFYGAIRETEAQLMHDCYNPEKTDRLNERPINP